MNIERSSIPLEAFGARVFDLFDRQWMLLTCGDFASHQFNTMTISWGSVGIMWNKPFVQVVVRPQRYTAEFIERFDSFTVSALPSGYRQALNLLGTMSGREGDKIADAGLTPIASTCVAAPGFAEAELIFECRKVYWQDLDPAHFLDPSIAHHYPAKDYHRIYYGEIVAIMAVEKYQLY